MLKPHLTRDSAEQYILGALAPEAVPPVVARHLHARHAVATLVAPADVLLPQLQAALPDAAIEVVDFRAGLGLEV